MDRERRTVTEVQQAQVWGDGGPREGALIYQDGALAAVFVRLDEEDAVGAYRAGEWFLEAGFGELGLVEQSMPATFAELDDARAWVETASRPGQAVADAMRAQRSGNPTDRR